MTFHDLHAGPLPPLLPNAWDVPSALALIDCGFSAIGTTSFGVACSQGSPDGGRTTKAANLALAHALERLPCDLSLDVETLIAPADHAAKVRAIKRRSPDLFVNARVDT
jgi:2-methylisocitrate lyase-like PEP mutase family enzyme